MEKRQSGAWNCLLANRVSMTGAFGWRTKLSQEIGKYMNIMDVVRSTLGGGTTMSAISSQLGLSQDQTQRATSATIPTLLADSPMSRPRPTELSSSRMRFRGRI